MSPTHPLFPLSGDSRQIRADLVARLHRADAYRERAARIRTETAMESALEEKPLTRSQVRLLRSLA